MTLESKVMYSIEEYKYKNDQYQKIIERQKVTIKTLRESMSHLISENELLIKRNKELEAISNAGNVCDSPINKSVQNLKETIKAIPVPPPRSPYRQPQETKQVGQKRPPVLKLVKSNHTPLKSQQPLEDSYKSDDPYHPLSSPSSTSSSDSYSIESEPSLHSPTQSHLEKPIPPKTPSYSTSILIEKLEKGYPKPSQSEPSTPVLPRTPRFDSLPQPDFILDSGIHIKVIHSDKAKKSNTEDGRFLISVLQKDTSSEIWRIEKSFQDLRVLDTKLREANPSIGSYLRKLPDKSLFSSDYPNKINEKKIITEDYIRQVMSLNSIDKQPLTEFLSTNKVHDLSMIQNNFMKQGYLSKKKRNGLGWKKRYLVIDHNGQLRYFENKNGPILGNINLSTCQIVSDPASEPNHAFHILEHKSYSTCVQHAFTASSLEEKQAWIYQIQLAMVPQSPLTNMMVLEPSSSTESHVQRPAPRQSRRKSSTSIPKPDETQKKTKKNHRKTFWPIKMFSHHQELVEAMDSDDSGENQVFGIPLEEAVSKSRVCDQYDLPAIVYRSIVYIETHGLGEEGIYRQSGSALEIKALKKRFNHYGDVKLLEDGQFHDIHAVVGLLKMWLRELPENILTEQVLNGFVKNIRDMDKQTVLVELGNLISSLPLANYTLLRFLCAHLIRVIENSDKNKMTLNNISIIFSVTLGIPSNLFNLMLLEFDYIFWTNRCDDHQTTEKALEMYMNSVEDLPLEKDQLTNLTQGRSKRNSVHYQEKTPKEFIKLERKLQAIIQDDVFDEENYASDGELEIAYFATRYNANSKKSQN